MPFMNKPLARAHMKRSRLRNRFLKNRSQVNRINYIKQRNYCVSLLRKTKKRYYAYLNEKDVADNKNSGRLLNLFFLTSLSQMKKLH